MAAIPVPIRKRNFVNRSKTRIQLILMLVLDQDIVSRIKSWLRPHLRPRRFHAFGVGMPKTGTHSLAAVLGGYRALHEPERQHFMRLIMDRASGNLPDAVARSHLRQIDRYLWVELNSSWINYLMLDMLVEEFPQAKFVLTIRDCYSWLDSIFNELLGRTHLDYMVQFHRWYADTLAPGSHEDGDRALAGRGLWPLDAWVRAWNQHNSRVIAMVPKDRLLVVRTHDIRRDAPRLAEFLGLRPDTLDTGRSHEYQAAAKFGLLSEIDGDYLRNRVEARGGDLMKRFFPEIRDLSDVAGYRPKEAAPTANAS